MTTMAAVVQPPSYDLDLLLDNFSVAATKSMAAAEAATQAETLAAAAAEEAAAAYLAAAAAVGTPDFDSLRAIAEAAERLLESLTLAAAQASQMYADASAQSMHASSAAFEAAILSNSDEEEEEEDADADDSATLNSAVRPVPVAAAEEEEEEGGDDVDESEVPENPDESIMSLGVASEQEAE